MPIGSLSVRSDKREKDLKFRCKDGNYSSCSEVRVCLPFLALIVLDCVGLFFCRFSSIHTVSAFFQCCRLYPSGLPSSSQSLFASCRIPSSLFVFVSCM